MNQSSGILRMTEIVIHIIKARVMALNNAIRGNSIPFRWLFTITTPRLYSRNRWIRIIINYGNHVPIVHLPALSLSRPVEILGLVSSKRQLRLCPAIYFDHRHWTDARRSSIKLLMGNSNVFSSVPTLTTHARCLSFWLYNITILYWRWRLRCNLSFCFVNIFYFPNHYHFICGIRLLF